MNAQLCKELMISFNARANVIILSTASVIELTLGN